MKRISAILGALIVTGAATAEPVVFEDVNVLPMTAEVVLEGRTVVVRDGIIQSITDGKRAVVPAGATVIDGASKYLIPGLADMHAHFHGVSRDGRAAIARMLALNGVTTILCMSGSRGVLELRDKIESGEGIGPRIFTTGPIMGNVSPTPDTFEDGVERVEHQHEAGYDFIKVYNQIPRDGYEGIMAEAKRLGLPVIGHSVRSVGIEGALANGQHIAHMEEVIYGYFKDDLDESKIPALAKRFKESGIAVVATLIAYHNIVRQLEDIETMLQSEGIEYLPERLVRTWRPDRNDYLGRMNLKTVENFLRPGLAFQQKLARAFLGAGVPVLMGTDCTIPIVIPGWSAHDELKELVEAGFTPYEALYAATAAPAKFLGIEDQTGSIEAGKTANLILLADNPLDAIERTEERLGVVVQGIWYDNQRIEELLEEVKPES